MKAIEMQRFGRFHSQLNVASAAILGAAAMVIAAGAVWAQVPAGDAPAAPAVPSVIATAMEAGLNVVWLVMDNAAFGTIAGLEQQHYGWSFGCVFERDGRPYRVDFASMARACGARGVMIESPGQLGPALKEALASKLPTVIQAPMENVPTPTPGHWNINDIYRRGE